MKNDEDVNIDLKKILSYKYSLLILLVIIGLSLNIYYFNTNKAVWWDEAEYLSFGKYFGSSIPYSMSETRAINYPIMLFIFSKIFSSTESVLRVLLVIISIGTLVASYYFFKGAFNIKIAFLATLMLITNYLYLFFQIRFLTEIPSMMFMLFGLYFFMNKKKNNLLTGLFIGLSIATRFTSFIIIAPMIIYQILKKDRLKDFSWMLFLVLGFVPSIIIDLIRHNIPLSEFLFMFSHNQNTAKNNALFFFDAFSRMFGAWSIPFFLIGTITMFLRAKNKKQDFLKIFFVFLFFVFHFCFYSFFSAWKEERYMINLLPFYYCIVSFGIFDAFLMFFKKINKNLKEILIIVILLLIIIPNINSGNASINYKADSYEQVKDMAEFVRDLIPLDAKIIANASPQASYYGEREILALPSTLEGLFELFKNETKTDIIILSAFEGFPEYVDAFGNMENFTILNAGFYQNQPVVYVIQYNRN